MSSSSLTSTRHFASFRQHSGGLGVGSACPNRTRRRWQGYAKRIEANAKTRSDGAVKIDASGHAADGMTITLYEDHGIRIQLPAGRKFVVDKVKENEAKSCTEIG
jgi:hypothetical protein